LIFFQQTLIENFQARFDLEFSSVIVIAIENVSRIDQGLIENCRAIHISEDALGVSPRRWGTPSCNEGVLSETGYFYFKQHFVSLGKKKDLQVFFIKIM
jgi:hypothetical protein